MISSEPMVCTGPGTEVLSALEAWIGGKLSPKRFRHSLGVAELCENLCRRFRVHPGRGRLAGLGHDMAREFPPDRLRETALRDGAPVEVWEEEHPALLHGRAGAVLLRELFGVRDQEALEAVRSHTLGDRKAGALSKILYVADYCEPSRDFVSPAFRKECLGLSLDGMVIRVIEEKWSHEGTSAAVRREATADRAALVTRDLYLLLKEKRGEG